MHNELTNLLPPERQRILAREYMLRVGTIVAMLVTALTLTASALLLPTYVLLSGSANAKKTHLATIESKLYSADEKSLSARLLALSSKAETLLALSSSPSASTIIREMLALPRPGISLLAFSYTPPAGKTPGTLAVTGSSATRDALRNYQLALQGAPFALSAVLPVSAYAKDTDIDFTITVTLAP